MEIEAKYKLPNETLFAEMKALSNIEAYTLSTGKLLTFTDTYYDTADHALMTAAYALRERQSRPDTLVTLKSLTPPVGNVHIRDEYEFRSQDFFFDQPDTWHDTFLRDRIRRMANGQSLQPIFKIEQERFIRHVTRKDVTVAEFCIDRAHFHLCDRELLYLGLEIELAEAGTEDDLNIIRNTLEQNLELVREVRSKYEIGLAFTQVPIPLVMLDDSNIEPYPNIQLSDSMAVAAMKTFEFHFGMMKQYDAGTYRGEDIIFVHDMRVEVRRMRSAFRVFAPYIQPLSSQPYLKVLKKIGKTLGEVRDLDVFREKFELYAAENNIAIQASTLTTAWNSAYTMARNTLLPFLANKRYLEFRANFTRDLSSVVDASQPMPTVADQYKATLDGQLQKVFNYYALTKQETPHPLHHFHQLRINLKHYRYCVEYFRNILGTAGEEIITELKHIQDHLGALQDAVVAHRQITSVLNWGMWHPPQQPYTLIPSMYIVSPDVQSYLLHIEETMDRLIQTFPEVWDRFSEFISLPKY